MTNSTKELFGDLLLDKKIVAALTDMGFEEPSPIQRETIPLCLAGEDVIGQAQTGTGKTAAFGIPIIQNLTDHKHIQALIMTPTRELAIQVSEEVGKIGRTNHVKALPVYGGQPIDRQIRALRSGVNIVIGTPGRLLDHLRRGTIKLDHIKFLVVDEADEMLDMEKQEPIEVGADLVAGSLIKNLGGGLAPTGGYIAGRADLVEAASYRLTAPGLGAEMGATLGDTAREFYQGLFLAPHGNSKVA